MATYTGDWQTDLHAILGQHGTHYDLANWVESKGFEVIADQDDIEHSWITRPGSEPLDERIVAHILGDADAVISKALM